MLVTFTSWLLSVVSTLALQTFVTLYDEILTIASSSFDTIFRHIVDKPDEPCLVHCTGGCRSFRFPSI